ncbi:MAG: hypothetical protein DMF09_07510 [Verrucomicrobia bacterium]|nr:MAG: hypothetical protein DMF09_07510 [Verrucomicrobiota bacterium]
MVKVNVSYTGDLHCDATHGPSQSKISTDAPMDNKGKGEAFSPTDLVATALGTCMTTTMGIKAQELGIDLRGMTVSVHKDMSKDAPRWIVALPSEVHIPLLPDSARNPPPDKIFLGRVAHASRALASASRDRELFSCATLQIAISVSRKDCFGATPKPAGETRALPVQPLHIIAHTLFQRKPRLVT